jgi:hypothetical protein
MAEEHGISGPGRELLAAYKAHRGPSPAAVERIAAALHEEAAGVVRLRDRRRWVVAAGLLLAAAIGLLALQSTLVPRYAAQGDAAAKYERTPEAPTPVQAREVVAAAPIEAPIEVAPVPVPARPRREAPVLAPQGPSLAEEMQDMRAAQAALAGGATAEALALLDAYARKFPDGRLHEEYLALRAIALCSGEPPAGQAEAAAFLAAKPRSVFATRVRGACHQ